MAKNGIFVSLFGSGSGGKGRQPTVQREHAPEKQFQPERTVRQQQVLRQDQGLYGKVFILSLVEFYDAIGGRSGRLADSLLTICDTVFADRMDRTTATPWSARTSTSSASPVATTASR